jgi:hypothetical protein
MPDALTETKPESAAAIPVAGRPSASFLIVDNFLPVELATAMRADIDAHFSRPDSHRPETHQVWNYWHVPRMYTYLRTQPEKVLQPARVEGFMERLREWSTDTLGLPNVRRPWLSLYVSGCGQGLHNDSKNGRFAFVYSLTRNERRTGGGETIVFRSGDPFLRNLRRANAGHGLYELIEPRFNRLVVFDDRMVHGVERVIGSMDPVEGRFVMHGHIEEAAPLITGALAPSPQQQELRTALERFAAECSRMAPLYHGPLVLRFTLAPAGRIASMRVLLDRVFSDQEGNPGWDAIRTRVIALLSNASFPQSPGTTQVTLPVMFGGTLRETPVR